MTLQQAILEEMGLSPIPVTVPTLVAMVTDEEAKNARAQIWTAMRRLETAGLVEKCGRTPDRRTLWKLAGPTGTSTAGTTTGSSPSRCGTS